MRSLFYAKSVSAMIASHSTRTRFWISSSNHPYEAAIKREAISDFPFLAPTRGFEPPTYRLGGNRSLQNYRKDWHLRTFLQDITQCRHRLK